MLPEWSMHRSRAGGLGLFLCVLCGFALSVIVARASAQVVSPVEIKDPALSALQQQYMDDLTRAGEDILANHFDYPFYLSRKLDLDQTQQQVADQPDRNRAPIAWFACACSLPWIRPRRSRANRSRPWSRRLCFPPSTNWCFPRAPNSPALWPWPGKHDPSIAPASFDSTSRRWICRRNSPVCGLWRP